MKLCTLLDDYLFIVNDRDYNNDDMLKKIYIYNY